MSKDSKLIHEEDAISKDKDILKGPFHAGEEAISEDQVGLVLKYLVGGDSDIFMELAKTLDASSLKALLNMRIKYKEIQ